ncbi:hypothetical protein BH23GEM8_BH23GEM8_14890 [soil metagenome]
MSAVGRSARAIAMRSPQIGNPQFTYSGAGCELPINRWPDHGPEQLDGAKKLLLRQVALPCMSLPTAPAEYDAEGLPLMEERSIVIRKERLAGSAE